VAAVITRALDRKYNLGAMLHSVVREPGDLGDSTIVPDRYLRIMNRFWSEFAHTHVPAERTKLMMLALASLHEGGVPEARTAGQLGLETQRFYRELGYDPPGTPWEDGEGFAGLRDELIEATPSSDRERIGRNYDLIFRNGYLQTEGVQHFLAWARSQGLYSGGLPDTWTAAAEEAFLSVVPEARDRMTHLRYLVALTERAGRDRIPTAVAVAVGIARNWYQIGRGIGDTPAPEPALPADWASQIEVTTPDKPEPEVPGEPPPRYVLVTEPPPRDRNGVTITEVPPDTPVGGSKTALVVAGVGGGLVIAALVLYAVSKARQGEEAA
jgi:hypothetical protein